MRPGGMYDIIPPRWASLNKSTGKKFKRGNKSLTWLTISIRERKGWEMGGHCIISVEKGKRA